jgi:hypothetical protein
MPADLPPRPGPSDQTLVLTRRPKSGFVNYPSFFQKRMVDGRARFMTKCDMLIGPCSCGYTHDEDDGWVREFLGMYNCRIETLILWGTELGSRGMVVEIPGYWKQASSYRERRNNCDVLVGKCVCGETHSPHEGWVLRLLQIHQAVILNMPAVEAPTTSSEPNIAESVPTRMPAGTGTVSYNMPYGSDRPQSETRVTRPATPRASRNVWGSFSLIEDIGPDGPGRDGPGRDESSPMSERPVRAQIPRLNGRWGGYTYDIPVPPSSDSPVNSEGLNPSDLETVNDIVSGGTALPVDRTPEPSRVDVDGCDCNDCRSIRNGDRGLREVARNWVLDAKIVRDGDWSDQQKTDWSRRNCNSMGVIPGWCNCPSCCLQRLSEAPHGV